MTEPEDNAKKARLERYRKTFIRTLLILLGFFILTLFLVLSAQSGSQAESEQLNLFKTNTSPCKQSHVKALGRQGIDPTNSSPWSQQYKMLSCLPPDIQSDSKL